MTDREPKAVQAARAGLAKVEERLDQHERDGSKARRAISDLESQVARALFESGRTGSPVDVAALREQITEARRVSIDSDLLANGAKRAVAKARDDLVSALRANYRPLAQRRDTLAAELAAERHDLDQRQAEHDRRVAEHRAAWEELLHGHYEARQLERDASGSLLLDEMYSPTTRPDHYLREAS